MGPCRGPRGGADGGFSLLEVNEHPYFRPQFKEAFFRGAVDLALWPALTGAPSLDPRHSHTFLEI